MEHLTIDTDKLTSAIKSVAPTEKPKRTKPRKIVKEFTIRIGKFQFIIQVWRFRK